MLFTLGFWPFAADAVVVAFATAEPEGEGSAAPPREAGFVTPT